MDRAKDIQFGAILDSERIVPAHTETALMGVIVIIEGNRRVP
jgi:hypothetical protein